MKILRVLLPEAAPGKFNLVIWKLARIFAPMTNKMINTAWWWHTNSERGA
jgi:hypothetical protein